MSKGGTTEKALLGLLGIGPMSGYDIRQLIAWSIGHFWNESYGQIYPTLKRMGAEGLVKGKRERQKGKPDRVVYALTAAGRKALGEWLTVPVAPELRRSELLLKLFFGAHVAAEVNREHIRAAMAEQTRALAVYEATAKKLRAESSHDPQLPFWLITLNMGRHHSRAVLEWGRETLRELDALEDAANVRRAS